MVKIGLKANANFLFSQMGGDTLGGTTGEPYWASIIHLTEQQFGKFKTLIASFGGDVCKSITRSNANDVDYECYFTKY